MKKTVISLLVIALIVGGGIWGYQYWLKSTGPISPDSMIEPIGPTGFVTITGQQDKQPGSENVLCTSEPEVNGIGRDVLPIAPEYAHLEFLGQLFTASECGDDRLTQVEGVKDGLYSMGVRFNLKADPSTELATLLEDLDFSCAQEASAESCREWTREDRAISISDLLQLKAYADQFSSDDCVSCG